LAFQQLPHLIPLLLGSNGKLYSHPKSWMSALNLTFYSQFQIIRPDNNFDRHTHRKWFAALYITPAGTDVSQSTTMRNGMSETIDVCSDAASMTGAVAAIGG
jgi:hypothetical protein